jgi:hypothetical protein
MHVPMCHSSSPWSIQQAAYGNQTNGCAALWLALLHAGMRVLLEPSPQEAGSWVVAEVGLAFGGVAPKSIMADKVGGLLTSGILQWSACVKQTNTACRNQRTTRSC